MRVVHDRLRAHLRGGRWGRRPARIRVALRPRPALRGRRPGDGPPGRAGLRRGGARHDLDRRDDRLPDGLRRAGLDRRPARAVGPPAPVRRRRGGPRGDRGPARSRRAGRAAGAGEPPRRPSGSAARRRTWRRTSRGWSCRATTPGPCTRWPSGWPSAPAGPTTTARAPTRPTSPTASTAADGGPASALAADRDRGPRRGHRLADPLQVPPRRLHRLLRRVGRDARRRHRLGLHRRRAPDRRPPGGQRPQVPQPARGLDGRSRTRSPPGSSPTPPRPRIGPRSRGPGSTP